MIREKTHPCASVQLPPLRSVGLRRVSCFLIKAARTVSVKICDLWAKYSRAACPIPHPHILTFHIQHFTPNISHSTFSTLLPPIYTLFPTAPRPASKNAILSASLQPAIIQPIIVRMSSFDVPHSAFPTLKRHLSHLDPCPFEAPSLTFRISIPKLS